MKDKTVYVETPSKQDLIENLKEAAPEFVTQDEQGNDILRTSSHIHTITYLGIVMLEQPEYDSDGNLIKEAVLTDQERCKFYFKYPGDASKVRKIAGPSNSIQEPDPPHNVMQLS